MEPKMLEVLKLAASYTLERFSGVFRFDWVIVEPEF
jgi:hypothetical protein